MRKLTKYVPKQTAVAEWSHIANLPLADDNPMNHDPIDLIIGADLYGFLLRDGLRKGRPDEPIAQKTVFGWILSGPTTKACRPAILPVCHGAVALDLEQALRRFWEVEELPQRTLFSPEEQQCEEHFRATHIRLTSGRYVVRLPFRNNCPPYLGDSRQVASAKFNRLEQSLRRDSVKSMEYSKFLREYEKLGHMSEIAEGDPRDQTSMYYIPHHAVIRAHSETTRLRVVFNASSQTSNGYSLNDHLLVGAKLQQDLSAIILRWRQFRYVVTADITKMYRQIQVDPRDANYQRILWRPTPSDELKEYRLLTVTYGTASAPFLALRTLKQLADDEGTDFPLALPVLTRQLYVDDCVFGANDLGAARATRDQLIALLARGGFPLRKWASNCESLVADIDPANHGLARSKSLHPEDSLSILGIFWHPERDTFSFKISSLGAPAATKRAILSLISRLYDPLGWVTPVTVTAKILIQRLWSLKCGWDDELPPEVATDWSAFQKRLPMLERINVARWTRMESDDAQAEIHGFADASTRAYAAAVYLRVENPDGRVVVSLLAAKSKVAPIKTLSVPRLELCAALLLARLVTFVQSELQSYKLPCYCWTDSTVTLAWLCQAPSRWKTFVANRVAKIQDLLPGLAWRHVATEENPADCASRGISADAIPTHPLWWSGPTWLGRARAEWPASTSLGDDRSGQVDARVVLQTTVPPRSEPWDLDLRFSSWAKLLRVTAYLMRFVRRASRGRFQMVTKSHRLESRPGRSLAVGEIELARHFWIKRIQAETFPEEVTALSRSARIKPSSVLASLHPYLDSHGLLRVRGRLAKSNLPDHSKFPIILRSHPLLTLIIAETHRRLLHAGPRLTLAVLRQECWIIRARTTVRAVIHRCVPCSRERALIPEQMMGELPEYRVREASRAFVHTGVDYAGPVQVRSAPGRSRASRKAYIAVWVCMTTKAIHLDLVSDYSAAAFVAAYERFAARRGIPSSVYSDNGTTFQGADRELASAFRAAIQCPEFANYLAGEGVQWHFLPPSAPHFGGLWEAAVRSMKHHLKRTIGSHALTYEEYSTLLCKIEASLNSRPIAATSDHLDDYQALTPGHFLIGSELTAIPKPSVLEISENRLSRWQLVQRLHELVWKAWKESYLQVLQQRPKWRTRHALAKCGQIVLLRDPNAPPSRWKIGKIIACHPGSDGLVRVVTVKTAESVYKRPIVKLSFLPVDINTETANSCVTAGGSDKL